MPAKIHISDSDIEYAMNRTGGAIAAAARLLGVSPRTLSRRLKDFPTYYFDEPSTSELARRYDNAVTYFRALHGHMPASKKLLKHTIWTPNTNSLRTSEEDPDES